MSELSAIDLVTGCTDTQFYVNFLITQIHHTFKIQSNHFEKLKFNILDEGISPGNRNLIEDQFNEDQKNFKTSWELQFYPMDWYIEFARENNILNWHGSNVNPARVPMLKSIEPISDYILYFDADSTVFENFQNYFDGYQGQTVLGCYIYPHYPNCYNKKVKGAVGGWPTIIRYQKFMKQYYEPFMEKMKSKLLYHAVDEWLLRGVVGDDFFDLGYQRSIYPSSFPGSPENAPWNKNHYDTLEFEKLNQIYQETIIANRSDLVVEKAVQPIPTYEDVNVKLFPQIFAWIKFRVMKTYYLQKLIRTIVPSKYFEKFNL